MYSQDSLLWPVRTLFLVFCYKFILSLLVLKIKLFTIIKVISLQSFNKNIFKFVYLKDNCILHNT